MGRFILVHVFTTLMSIVSIGRLSEQEKGLDIWVLRQQLALLQRRCHKPVKPNRAEKMTLAILAARLKQATQRPTNQLRDVIRIFQPETVMRCIKNWYAVNVPISASTILGARASA
jgi:hypothetical protein